MIDRPTLREYLEHGANLQVGALPCPAVTASLFEVERWHVNRALEAHLGNMTRTAASLGVTRAGLYHTMTRLGIGLERYRKLQKIEIARERRRTGKKRRKKAPEKWHTKAIAALTT